jgi:hypothetical protein
MADKRKLSEINLPPPIQRKLKAAGVDSVEKLTNLTWQELIAVGGIGYATVAKIEAVLEDAGLSLLGGGDSRWLPEGFFDDLARFAYNRMSTPEKVKHLAWVQKRNDELSNAD